jgi:anti-anti-sigma factor
LDSGKTFELEHQHGCARLVLNPNLNASNWADIERSGVDMLSAVESTKSSGVIVDLSSLDYLGSAQLALLVRLWKATKARNGRMVVLVTAPVVREVIKTAGLSSLWEFADSLPNAYASLGMSSSGGVSAGKLSTIIGLVALAGAVAVLGLSLAKVGGLDAKTSLVIQLSCSGVALLAGLWTVIRGTGVSRGLGIAMVVLSPLLAVAEVLMNQNQPPQ